MEGEGREGEDNTQLSYLHIPGDIVHAGHVAPGCRIWTIAAVGQCLGWGVVCVRDMSPRGRTGLMRASGGDGGHHGRVFGGVRGQVQPWTQPPPYPTRTLSEA